MTLTPVFVLAAVLALQAFGDVGDPPWARAPQVTADSPSVPDIQAAVERLPEGGTVRVPAGRAEAIGTVRVPAGVSLIAPGPGKTVMFRASGTDSGASDPILRLEGAPDKPSQIAGISFIGMKDPASKSWDTAVAMMNVTQFRVDHCRFERFGAAAVSVRGHCSGVVDHCLFVDNFKKPIANVGYGVVIMGPGDWREDVRAGTGDSVFVEDCEFTGSRHAVASNAGAWYVFRHNHVHGNDNSQAIDAHGPGYGSKRGTQWVEVYNNLVEKPVGGSVAVMLRGGGGLVFGNTVRDYKTGIVLTLDFDGKLDWSRPYPIPDQIHKVWCWQNTLNGAPAAPVIPKRSADHIKAERDFFACPMPDYKPFEYPHPLARGGPLD